MYNLYILYIRAMSLGDYDPSSYALFYCRKIVYEIIQMVLKTVEGHCGHLFDAKIGTIKN